MEDFEVDFDDIDEDNDQDDHFDDLVEPDYEIEFPGFTEYTTEFSLFGRSIYKIPETGKKYWHHWEIQPFYPILIITFIFASYFFTVSLITNTNYRYCRIFNEFDKLLKTASITR